MSLGLREISRLISLEYVVTRVGVLRLSEL